MRTHEEVFDELNTARQTAAKLVLDLKEELGVHWEQPDLEIDTKTLAEYRTQAAVKGIGVDIVVAVNPNAAEVLTDLTFDAFMEKAEIPGFIMLDKDEPTTDGRNFGVDSRSLERLLETDFERYRNSDSLVNEVDSRLITQ